MQHRRVCADAVPGEAACLARIRTDVDGSVRPLATAGGFGPTDVVAAYSIPTTGGYGTTVAIVDAFDDPHIEADLGVYRAQYGLPACTTANGCFKKVNQSGSASPLPTVDTGWAGEIALDVEMVSAACPNCKIVLVEANTQDMPNLRVAVNEAAALGANVISASWGGPEDNSLTASEVYFDHPGIPIFVAAGDSGYSAGPTYPATSAHVIAVGGTSLTRDTSARGWSERVWKDTYNGDQSGCSAYIAKPTWQTDSGCARRTIDDVSAVADPNTGVAVYDSFGGTGWAVYGGTSVGAPLIAGIWAASGHRADAAPFIYAHATDFWDVTTGNDGTCTTGYLCTAGAGYDGPTGFGTPNGAALAADGAPQSPPPKPPACDHTACVAGDHLDEKCSPCVATVVSHDFRCEFGAWSATCAAEAHTYCATTCSTRR